MCYFGHVFCVPYSHTFILETDPTSFAPLRAAYFVLSPPDRMCCNKEYSFFCLSSKREKRETVPNTNHFWEQQMTPLHFAFFPSSSSSKEGVCFYGASEGKEEEEEAGIDTLPLFSFGAFKVPDTPFPTHSRERKKSVFFLFRNYGFETVLPF